MILKNKTFRYYYWIIIEFAKKNLRLILISFFVSLFILITLVSIAPYLTSILIPKKETIGLVGDYYIDELPEEVTSKISQGLVFLNEKGEIKPALATSWETRDRGREFVFRLRRNLLWSDGSVFRARDINYGFKDIETKVIDDQTIVFRLNQPLLIFPTYLTKPLTKKNLVGILGLYKVDKVRIKSGLVSEIILSPNKADLPSITYRFYRNDGDLINAFKMGEIDKMSLNKRSSITGFYSWKNTIVERSVDYSKVLTLFLNLNNSKFADKEVRQAIENAIPKEKFAKEGQVASGPVPPSSWAYSPNIKTSVYDLDLARRTLKTDASASAKLEFRTYYDYLNIATQINKNLQDAGLATNLQLTSFDEGENKFDMLLAFWKIPVDPDQYFFWHSTQTSGGNITSYKNVKVDKLLEDGRNTVSTSERKNHYLQFQKVLTDDVPAVFLYYPYVYTVRRK
jgi:peptide/nickel transport system substrate-binding protein